MQKGSVYRNTSFVDLTNMRVNGILEEVFGGCLPAIANGCQLGRMFSKPL